MRVTLTQCTWDSPRRSPMKRLMENAVKLLRKIDLKKMELKKIT
jgi:hypothetical protein